MYSQAVDQASERGQYLRSERTFLPRNPTLLCLSAALQTLNDEKKGNPTQIWTRVQTKKKNMSDAMYCRGKQKHSDPNLNLSRCDRDFFRPLLTRSGPILSL
jgi:hypothetical protein